MWLKLRLLGNNVNDSHVLSIHFVSCLVNYVDRQECIDEAIDEIKLNEE